MRVYCGFCFIEIKKFKISIEAKFEELEKCIDKRIELKKSEVDKKGIEFLISSFEIIANKISKKKLKSNEKVS